MIAKPLMSVLYAGISGLTLWILSGIMPGIMSKLPSGTEKDLATAFYWVVLLLILILPQYVTWMTDLSISLITPVVMIFTGGMSLLVVTGLALTRPKLLAAVAISDNALVFFNIIYGLAVFLVLLVPQYLVWEQFESPDGDE